jgi:uncharacterized membrane protein YgcG
LARVTKANHPVAGRILTAYQQQQTPPQQRSLPEGSYQQQSYKAGAVVFAFFASVFLPIFFIIDIFHTT